MSTLIQPKPYDVTLPDGTTKTFILSKFPAVAGREIVTQYPLSAMPKVGDYQVNESVMLKLMAFVAVEAGDVTIPLSTKTLVNNHVPDWETLAKLEIAMMEYNCSFFGNGRASTFFELFAQKTKSFLLQMSTDLSAQSSQAARQASPNSKQRTRSKTRSTSGKSS